MTISYKPLWKLLIDRDIKKKDLCKMAGISPATITKMGKGGQISTSVLEKICSALQCSLTDVMETVSITGGTFTGEYGVYSYGTFAEGFIEGGTFVNGVDEAYLAEGVELREDANGNMVADVYFDVVVEEELP